MGGHSSNLFHGTTGSPQMVFQEYPSGSGSSGAKPAASSSDSKRESLLSAATTEQVRRIINELYREGADVGDGGTADAIREELATGKPVGGRSHVRKGKERLRQIEKILLSNPNHPDREILEQLRDDLKNALEGN